MPLLLGCIRAALGPWGDLATVVDWSCNGLGLVIGVHWGGLGIVLQWFWIGHRGALGRPWGSFAMVLNWSWSAPGMHLGWP